MRPRRVARPFGAVVMARRPHPYPSRTRSLSSSAPMVLRGQTAWESRTPPPHPPYKNPPGPKKIRGDFCFYGFTGLITAPRPVLRWLHSACITQVSTGVSHVPMGPSRVHPPESAVRNESTIAIRNQNSHYWTRPSDWGFPGQASAGMTGFFLVAARLYLSAYGARPFVWF